MKLNVLKSSILSYSDDKYLHVSLEESYVIYRALYMTLCIGVQSITSTTFIGMSLYLGYNVMHVNR